ncbi:bifunctional enoyl-CoA hydratase/phosphate acetyltransferase [Roseateles oligotrophus]|uniref:Bifunctional enoyl-CoA hydratase/phosphate acetyltransferase n=1 Tax=Roseateles oligotrophus TaxID=1769250 RepID=A0ABT2YJ08_9BURK|nr:bifunctional enoyl-CoA hydratase/phosphate acetyltransferase [Roseateles oligotrophus]MCV2370056.1 bifunctional enoyl-CoA hydratase/phosphate acetyltransferase [Roseateles oligotrophus]
MNAPDLLRSDWLRNRTYDELTLGQSARLVRTLKHSDIQAFALVSGDVNPAHLDAEYAEGTRFHGVIAHGMWGGALISSVLGNEFPGPGTIYMEQTLRFSRPVHVGDTLTIVLTVLEMFDDSGIVKLGCEANNQKGQAVISGLATVLAPRTRIERPRPALPEMHFFSFDAEARMNAWLNQLKPDKPLRCAVVQPCSEDALRAALLGAARGLITPWLIGPEARIRALAEQLGLDLHGCHFQPTAHSHAAALQACEMAAAGQLDLLAQGSLSSEELLAAVRATPALDKGSRLAHVYRFDIPSYAKPLFISDAGINIRPDLDAKAEILRLAIGLAQATGVACPKVALLSAVETITERITSTLDAAALCKMAQRGQIEGAVLDGPLAFDSAVNLEAASLQGLNSPVAGDADILLAPDLESGSLLAKLLEYMAGAASCGVVLGARVPLAMSGRSDSVRTRLGSMGLAVLAVSDRKG